MVPRSLPTSWVKRTVATNRHATASRMDPARNGASGRRLFSFAEVLVCNFIGQPKSEEQPRMSKAVEPVSDKIQTLVGLW
jgi:hypothetical protein